MGTRTIKTGTKVTVKQSSLTGVVKSIDNGKYFLSPSESYYAHELIAEKTKPTEKKKSPIKKEGALTRLLTPAYQILRIDFLLHNKLCRINVAGCTRVAKEVHHMCGRAGWWLIVMKFFLPTCRNCHNWATKHSKEAAEKGVSQPRNTMPIEITPASCMGRHEKSVLKKLHIEPPT